MIIKDDINDSNNNYYLNLTINYIINKNNKFLKNSIFFKKI